MIRVRRSLSGFRHGETDTVTRHGALGLRSGAASQMLYEHLDHPAVSSTRWAAPVRYAAMVAMGLCIVSFGTWGAKQGLAVRAAQQTICREQLAALRARNPFIERYVMPSDPCLALEVVRTQR